VTEKKITILTQYFPPEMGAPQSRLWETAVGLKKRGWQVHIITAMPNYPTGKIFENYKGKLYSNETIEGITIQRFWLYASNSKKTIPRIINMLSFSWMCLFAWFKLIKIKPNYIMTESPPLTLALSGLILSKTTGAKHIMNVSDLWPLSAYELGAIEKGNLFSLLEWLEKFLYKNSFACTGQSQEIITAIKNKGGIRCHLYRNGVDFERFDIKTKPNNMDTSKIVYAGLLGVAQGILVLCKAVPFKQLGFEFHIYGDGAEKKELEAFLTKNPDCGIYYQGNAPRKEIPTILHQYDLTIIPLIKPIFGAVPSKIYEAMAAGLPIIFAGGGEGAKLIKQHNTGWICEPSDFIAMTKTLSEISKLGAEELNQIKANCKLAAQNTFNREIQINQLHNFLINT
jgi:glycosyltransferase involved in cell wall biosynthesis